MKLNIVYNCDVLDGFKKIPDNSIDLIVTSPPYNVGIDYDSWNDNMEWDNYLNWCSQWLSQCYRVLKSDGRIAINHYINFHIKGNNSQFPLMDFREIQTKIGFHVHKLIIWEDKNLSKLSAFGSFKSSSAPFIQTPYEGILISYKDVWKKESKGESTMSSKEFIDLVSGVWKCKPETNGLTKANFPIQLPLNCINLLTYKNDIVLDPFMGSGTTAIASIKSKRNYIGFEISKNYFEIAQDRIKEFIEIVESSNNLNTLIQF